MLRNLKAYSWMNGKKAFATVGIDFDEAFRAAKLAIAPNGPVYAGMNGSLPGVHDHVLRVKRPATSLKGASA